MTTGRVIGCNPAGFTADVLIDGVRTITACPILNIYGSKFGRDMTWISSLRGAKVLLVDVGSQYAIIGTIPEQIADGTKQEDVPSAAMPGYGGDNEKTYQAGMLRDFSSGRPRDIMAGDKVLRTEEGAELSLLRGGLARLKASPLAQIVLGRLKDFVRVIARNLQIWTDFGEINFTHTEEGKVGMHIKGGALFSDETHPDSDAFTVNIWAGTCPGGDTERFRIQVTDSSGGNEVSVGFDTDGNMKIDIAGDQTTSVQGNTEESVQGEKSVLVQGDSSDSVAGNKNVTVLGTSNETAIKEKTITAGGMVTIASTAGITLSAPAVSISGLMSISQSDGGAAEVTSPMVFKSTTTFEGMATFNGGVTGDNT